MIRHNLLEMFLNLTMGLLILALGAFVKYVVGSVNSVIQQEK